MSGLVSRNKPGRKTALFHGKVSKERLAEVTARLVLIPKIAKELHLAENTVRKYAKMWGIPFRKAGRPKGHHKHYGGLIRWVREHRGVALPCSTKEIVALTGCSEDAVKSYLRRQRAAIKRYLAALPDLKQSGIRFRSKSGVVIPFRAVRGYTLSFHPWHLSVLLTCEVGGKALKRRFTFAQFKRFAKGAISQSEAPHPLPPVEDPGASRHV